MKPLLPIAIVLFLLPGCSDEKKNWANTYDSLTAAVIGVFTYDLRTKSVFIKLGNDETKRNFDIKFAPVFQQVIKTVFDISDTSAIRELIATSPSLDTTVKIASVNVRYDNNIPDSIIQERWLGDLSIIPFFLMLPTKDGKQCIVYYYKMKAGIEVTVLKKKNNKWYIASTRAELLE